MRWLFLICAWPLLGQGSPEAAVAVLKKHCFGCHAGAVKLAGLDLSTQAGLLAGGAKGAAVDLNQVHNSRLLKAVKREAGLAAMPPTKPLAAEEVALLEEWVKGGAKYPAASAETPKVSWWSFQPPQRPPAPAIGAIDHFINAKLREKNLPAAPRASRATLIRRAYYDLTGLPPTAAQVEAFVADPDPQAFAKLVDSLLASPRYGEKWGRHWLDLVRYSDTAGFELDSYVADAWRYRDYVIDSFNADKPYNRFIQEQLAADEYWPEDPIANTGTGFFCVGPNRDLFPDQADINRVETLTDYTDTTASVFLGLTAGCARCHDHKFDPISQKDYYRLQAVFAPAVKTKVALNRLGSLGWETDENTREIQLRELGAQIRAIQDRCQRKLYEAKLARLSPEVQQALQTPDNERTPRQKELQSEYSAAVRVTDEEIRECLNAEETARLNRIEHLLVSMFKGYREKPFACGVTDVGDYAPKTLIPVKGRGEPEEVKPGFFSALGGGEVPERSFERKVTGPIPMFPTTGRRHALAEWLTNPQHPLVSRVMVNRIWQYHFGRGLVATPSDYGSRGAAPSHPELLDWLATEFVAQGWSVKHMHRLMMLSEAYQRDSNPSAAARQADPENVYLSHFTRRRLTAEELRDSVLAASGRLNLKMYGRPVVVPLEKEEMYGMIGRPEQMWVVTADETEHTRRSIYLQQRRTFRVPMMEVFDAPEPMLSCSRREASTIAPQSLTLLNGSLVRREAQAAATRWTAQYAENAELVNGAWRQVLARPPAPDEAALALRFLAEQEKLGGSRKAAAMELARALMNLNEFLYVD
jgi:cytochrome c551/c552